MNSTGTTRFGALIALVFVFCCASAERTNAVIEFDPDALIHLNSSVSADSIAVGQRFRVRHVFDYPDSLEMLDISGIDPGACRVVSLIWKDDSSEGRKIKTADLTLMTLDLEQARFPELAFDFETPSGDTLRVFAEEIVVPVRHVVTAGAEPKPLKAQWEAPRNYLKWIVIAALAALAVAAAIFWLRRRRARLPEARAKPRLPADYVALSELTRIEKLDLLAAGKYKRYYSLITEVIRKYIQERFDVDAMDRTTSELLGELERCGERIAHLDGLLSDADLVKFAKHRPGDEVAATALSLARRIVVNTTPKAAVTGAGETVADATEDANAVSREQH